MITVKILKDLIVKWRIYSDQNVAIRCYKRDLGQVDFSEVVGIEGNMAVGWKVSGKWGSKDGIVKEGMSNTYTLESHLFFISKKRPEDVYVL